MNNLEQNTYKYLPISKTDQDWGLFITTAGQALTSPGSIYPAPVHPSRYLISWDKGRVLDEYQLVFITDGKGEFESDKAGKKAIESGDLIINFPGIRHRYRPSIKQGWKEYWVGFKGDYADRLFEKKFFQPNKPIISIGKNEEILQSFLTILNYIQNEPVGVQQLLSAEVIMILAKLLAAQKSGQVNNSHIEKNIQKAKFEMLEHLGSEINCPELASSLNMGYEYFRRCFKKITGLAPHQYHLQLRINRAKELLSGSDLSVKEISNELGFENQYYFSRIFSKKTGKAPTFWRNKK